jgi:hypothetical protein
VTIGQARIVLHLTTESLGQSAFVDSSCGVNPPYKRE